MLRSLATLFPRGNRRGHRAAHRLVQAYREVFGKSREDVEIVLADLAAFSGFYRVTPPEAGDLAYNEGKRAVYARIFSLLRMTDEEIRGLEEAARHEAVVSAEEGDL